MTKFQTLSERYSQLTNKPAPHGTSRQAMQIMVNQAERKPGIIFVKKVNHIAQFSYGTAGSSFQTIYDAEKALDLWLAGREDKAELTIEYLSR